MKPVIDKKAEKVTIRADKKADKVTIRADKKADKVTIRADEGKKHVKKVELKTHDVDTVKYVEKKLVDRGVGRMDRRPADGLPLKHDPKKGHGGKYTWEGPEREFEAEMGAEPAVDERDPNYVEEETEEGRELVVGEVEVAKAAGEGVARIEVDPRLKVD